MQIVPDWSLVAMQAIPFLATLVALHFILFRPMLAYLAERDAAVSGTRAEARELEERVEAARARWESRLAVARAEGAAHRARLHDEAMAVRTARVEAARREADQRVAEALAEIERAREESRVGIEGAVRALADDIRVAVLPGSGLEQRGGNA